MTKSGNSPMMDQYFEIKNKYPDTLLFFRVGDFYEMFYDDAITASKAIDLTLTGKDCGKEERAPMCGVPHHAANTYIDKLIELGFKVAICEQVEDPATAKGLVKRDVIRVVTAGTVTNSELLDDKSNNYLCCIYKNENIVGTAFVDVTTGDLYATETPFDIGMILSNIARYNPSEIICNGEIFSDSKFSEQIKIRIGCALEQVNDYYFDYDFASEKIKNQFGEHAEDLSVCGHNTAYICVGVLLEYISNTNMCSMPHINDITYYSNGQFMDLDFYTRRNLEIVSTIRENKRRGSLLWVLDDTKTSMGARLLKSWIEKPLTNCPVIRNRLNAIDELYKNTILRENLRGELNNIQDIERIIGRILTGGANCRDLLALCASLKPVPFILEQLKDVSSKMICELRDDIDSLEDICSLIDESIVDEDTPVTVKEGGIIKDGYNENVDKYRKAIKEGATWIASIEQSEKEKTGIKTLKIKFNKVFGYYIEVSKSYMSQVPETYVRKQTLANCERYITSELKEVENSILSAEEKINALEYSIFCDIRNTVSDANLRIQKTAKAIALLDTLCSLATVAVKNNYCMPYVDNSDKIDIRDGRHPVVEKVLKSTLFVPNDTYLSNNDRVSIITGPNMAGKSTYMRQTALIVLMAQMGSFVPASSAEIGIVDKIFTRVGASDDLTSGQSTFMVEMIEVANILDNATSSSLLILDEIGRGTSTYDGLSIAWSVVEHIANKRKLGAKTLFATHYHELTDLEEKVEGVKNYCIAVKKRGDDITFLRKIIRGGADDSYGIEVAKLAGVKNDVIKRAKEIVKTLESNDINKTEIVKMKEIKKKEEHDDLQMGLFDIGNNEIVEKLKKIDVTTMTPIEALNTLYQLKTEADEIL